jgi:hypothetical protein
MQSPPVMTPDERAEYVAFVQRMAQEAHKAGHFRYADHLTRGAEIAAIPPEPP